MKLIHLAIIALTLSGCSNLSDSQRTSTQVYLPNYPDCQAAFNNASITDRVTEKRYDAAEKCLDNERRVNADNLRKKQEEEKKDALNKYPSCANDFSKSHDSGMKCMSREKREEEQQAYMRSPEGIAATQKQEALNMKNKKRCEYYLNDIKQKYDIASAKVRTANGAGKTVICTYMITQPTSYGTNVQNIIVVQGNFINNVYTIRD